MSAVPIVDYSSLQQTVLDYLNRPDLSTQVMSFIANGEAQIYNRLRVAAMEKPLALTITAPATQPADNAVTYGTAPVPADYIEMRELYLSDASGNVMQQLERTTPFYIHQQFNGYSGVIGQTAYFAREGTNFIFAPINGSANASGIYWSRPVPLSTTNATNWLTSSNPMLIMQAAMAQAASYLADAQALDYWGQQFEANLGQTQAMDQQERMSGSPPVMRRG